MNLVLSSPLLPPLQVFDGFQSTHSTSPDPQISKLALWHGGQLLKRRQDRTWQVFTVCASAGELTRSPVEEDWRVKCETLLKGKVRSVSVLEAQELQKEQGYTILDVRPQGDYAEAHPIGAINVELYRLIKKWTAWDIARRVAYAFFGIWQGTEENPDFLKDIGLKFTKESPLIVACAMGGTLRSTFSLPEGKESRSLIAIYMLILEGYTNILHLEGGIQAWVREELPVETEPQ